MSFESAIAQFGLLAIFLGAGTEGEAAAVAGGLVAHRQLIPLWQVGLASFAGSLTTGQVLFLLTRSGRESALMCKLSAKPAYQTVTRALEKRPLGFILVYRFIFGVRTLTPLILGGSQLSAARFAVLNAVAAALWAAVFTGLGYGFGTGIESLFGRLHPTHHLILIGVVLLTGLLAAFIGRQWLRAHAARAKSG